MQPSSRSGQSPPRTPDLPPRVVPPVTSDPTPEFLPIHVSSPNSGAADGSTPSRPALLPLPIDMWSPDGSVSPSSPDSSPDRLPAMEEEGASAAPADATPLFQPASADEPPLPDMVFAKADSPEPETTRKVKQSRSSPDHPKPSVPRDPIAARSREEGRSSPMSTSQLHTRTLQDVDLISPNAIRLNGVIPAPKLLQSPPTKAAQPSPAPDGLQSVAPAARSTAACVANVAPAHRTDASDKQSLPVPPPEQTASRPVRAAPDTDVVMISSDSDSERVTRVPVVNRTARHVVNTREVSERVKNALAVLPLQNVAVEVPDLEMPPRVTANLKAIISSLEDILQNDKSKRRTDQLAVRNPERCISLITTSRDRAYAWEQLLKEQSSMRVAKHGVDSSRAASRTGRKRARSDEEDLETLFGYKDVIITLPSAALDAAEHQRDYMRRIGLLLFDVHCPETVSEHDVAFSEKGHPCAMLMRDYYRSLPFAQRPRVLAVIAATQPLKSIELGPLEHNLFAGFTRKTGNAATWRSCYGKGSRPLEAGHLDVECISYAVETTIDCNLTNPMDRRRAVAKAKRDRRAMSKLENLEEQLGPVGLMFYQRRRRHRFTSKACGLHGTEIDVNHGVPYRVPRLLLGLSQKMCHLLNELQIAYSASTKNCMLRAIIYAGRPEVAAAMGEIIRAMPVFEALTVRVVLGTSSGTSFETYSKDDDGETVAWQGEETDTEAIENFVASEAQVLIVASQYCTKGKKSVPLPGCAIVFRFDNSVPDPNRDGGGGRCRVITFKENPRKRPPRPNGNDVPKAPVAKQAVKPAEKESSESMEVDGFSHKAVLPVGIKGIGTDRTGNKRSSVAAAEAEVVDGEDEGTKEYYEGGAKEYYARPAKALLGPEKKQKGEGYMYQILTAVQSSGDHRSIGLDRFLIVLSEKLGDNDCTVPLSDTSSRIENESGIAAHVRLKFIAAVFLSDEQLDLARQYTATIFSIPKISLQVSRFEWEGGSERSVEGQAPSDSDTPTDRKYLRRYVLLPTATRNSEGEIDSSQDEASSCDLKELRARALAKYFKPEVTHLKEEEQVAGIDWNAVNALLQFTPVERTRTEVYKDNGLAANQFEELQASFVLSGLRGQPAKLCGNLRYDLCPLSYVTRSQNFALAKDGTLIPHGDLRNLVNIAVTEETLVKLQAEKANGTAGVELATQAGDKGTLQEEPLKQVDPNTKKIAVRWCRKDRKFVVDNRITGMKRKRGDWGGHNMVQPAKKTNKGINLYDPDRNVRKKRMKWVGSVRYPYERYYRKFNQARIRVLDQPMLTSGRPDTASFEQLISAIRGKPVSEICNDIVTSPRDVGEHADKDVTTGGLQSQSKDDKKQRQIENGKVPDGGKESKNSEDKAKASRRPAKKQTTRQAYEENYLLPERCNRYPLSIGVIFLPAVLQNVEQHLLLCELRQTFDKPLGLTSDLNSMAEAVTATSVNASSNYERYELLGDAVLKLSCTLRLFTDKPHDDEGMMHSARSIDVSNLRLCECGHAMGLQSFLRFRSQRLHEWKPPGTDVEGKKGAVSVKGLADVVEALCGHYFLAGVNCGPCEKEGCTTARESYAEKVECESGADRNGSDELRASPGEKDNTGNDKPDSPSDVDQRDQCETTSKSNISLRRRESPLSAAAVERGYVAARRFLEVCNVFNKPEPGHREVLLSAIQSMCPKEKERPQEVSVSAFPYDKRLSNPGKPWEEEFGPLEHKIGYKFKRRPLLICALTHASYAKNSPNSRSGLLGKKDQRNIGAGQTFERLEFLGDAVADFCVVRYLFEKYPGQGPGALTNLKSNVVSNEAFARTTIAWGLHKYLFHESEALAAEIKKFIEAVKEEDTREGLGALKKTLGEIAAPKVLGDIFEAILGAVFVDSGLQEAWRVCMRLLANSLRVNADANRSDVHPGQELQDLVLRKWKIAVSPPSYHVEADIVDGKRSKAKIANVYIDGLKIASGRGTTDKRAKLKAAVAALARFEDLSEGSSGEKLMKNLKERYLARRVEAERMYNL